MSSLLRTHFVYCIDQQPDGSYVLLNRRYKPVGFTVEPREHVEYGEFPVAMKLKGLTAKLAAQLSWNGSDDRARVYLYHDGSHPFIGPEHMAAYLKRLHLLMTKVDASDAKQAAAKPARSPARFARHSR